MLCQTVDEELRVEAVFTNILVDEQCLWNVTFQERLVETEIVVVVEHVEVLDCALIGDIALARSRHLVEDGERVAHCAISLLGNHVEGCCLGSHATVGADVFQLLHDVGHLDAREVVDLAARENRRDNLLLLGGCQNENRVFGRLFQRLQKRVESGGGEHVHLVDDKHTVFAHLWRNTHLVHDGANVVHRVVAGGVELDNVVRALLIKRLARFTFIARLTVGGQMLAVDGFCKDTRASGFAHTSRSTEQVGVSQFVAADSRFQRMGERLLPYHRCETRRAVFPCRYNVVFTHRICGFKSLNYKDTKNIKMARR